MHFMYLRGLLAWLVLVVSEMGLFYIYHSRHAGGRVCAAVFLLPFRIFEQQHHTKHIRGSNDASMTALIENV